ncbi:MAG: hypothetical protein ACFFAE_17280 [Candidatus Hodarchaeota archaeon]
MRKKYYSIITLSLLLLACVPSSIVSSLISTHESDTGYKYIFIEHQSGLSSYVSWTENLRTNYERTRDPIGQGRGGYYWGTGEVHEWMEPGYCCELLCNGWGKTGIEIFDFPITGWNYSENAEMIIYMDTPNTQSWYNKGSYDIFVNNQLIGAVTSPDRGQSQNVTITFSSSVLKEGNNNIFLVFNEDRSAYGILTRVFWIYIGTSSAPPSTETSSPIPSSEPTTPPPEPTTTIPQTTTPPSPPPPTPASKTIEIDLEKRFIRILEEVKLTIQINNPRQQTETFTYIVTAPQLYFRGEGHNKTHNLSNNITLGAHEGKKISLVLWYEISATDLLSSVHTFDINLVLAENPGLKLTPPNKEWVWVYTSYQNMQRPQISSGSLLGDSDALLYEVYLDKACVRGYIKFKVTNNASSTQTYKIQIVEASQYLYFEGYFEEEGCLFETSLDKGQQFTKNVWFSFGLPEGCAWGLMPFTIQFWIENVEQAKKEFVIESHREYDISYNSSAISTYGTYEENNDDTITVNVEAEGFPSNDIGVAIQTEKTGNSDPLLPTVELTKDFLELVIPIVGLGATLSGGNPKLVALYWGLTGIKWFLSAYIFLSKVQDIFENTLAEVEEPTDSFFVESSPAFTIGILFLSLIGYVLIHNKKKTRKREF